MSNVKEEVYLRFVVPEVDEGSGREMGLFAAGGILSEEDKLYDHEIKLQKQILIWFENNLVVPDVQASESNYYSKPNAISWFKSDAIVHIAKMREYVEILKAHNMHVKQLMTERPGKIVYEDEFQVAAIPFKDTFK